jgi:hypothetical protein
MPWTGAAQVDRARDRRPAAAFAGHDRVFIGIASSSKANVNKPPEPAERVSQIEPTVIDRRYKAD